MTQGGQSPPQAPLAPAPPPSAIPAARRDAAGPGGTRRPGRGSGQGGVGFARSAQDRVLTGVAGGLGRRLGIDPVLLRLAFAVLATAGGVGVVLYLLAWALSTPAPGSPHAPDDRAERELPAPRRTGRQTAGVALLTLGLLVALRDAGLWFGDAVTWPLALMAAGSVVLLRGRADQLAPSTALGRLLRGQPGPGGVATALRAVAGALLIIGGVAVFLAAGPGDLTVVGPVLLAMLVTAAGLGLLLGPRLWEVSREAAEERRERIRSAERAEMAAHLHDSVLQTLALIQRSDDPREMARLARGQERDLRAWLYGSPRRPGTLRAAIEDLAERVDARHGLRVEPVLVGATDVAVDERIDALLGALGEALENVARHAGVAEAALFVEVGADGVDASVLDEGTGFDPDRVPPGRLGLEESVRGRMERAGGTAEIDSAPGAGTEVRLRLPDHRPVGAP